MKTILKTLTLATLLVAVAPAQAMFSRLGKAYANISMNQRPLIATGALSGIAGYAIGKRLEKNAAAEEYKSNPIREIVAHCKQRPAETAYASIAYPTLERSTIQLRLAQEFYRCQRYMPREKIFRENIQYAIWNSNDTYPIFGGHYQKSKALAREHWAKTAAKLQNDWDQEKRNSELMALYYCV